MPTGATDDPDAAAIAPLDRIPVLASPLDAATVEVCWQWLTHHRVWGQLSEGALRAIAQISQQLTVAANTVVYQKGHRPNSLFLLHRGTVEK